MAWRWIRRVLAAAVVAAVTVAAHGSAAIAAGKCEGANLRGAWVLSGHWALIERFRNGNERFALDGLDIRCDVKFNSKGKGEGLCHRGFYHPWPIVLELKVKRDCSLAGDGKLTVIGRDLDYAGDNVQLISGWLTPDGTQLVMTLEQGFQGRTVRTGQVVSYRRP